MDRFGKSTLADTADEDLQVHEITNKCDYAVEVMVEPFPDRYILRQDDEMRLQMRTKSGTGLTINLYDRNVQIYCGWETEPEVRINGEIAEPDWETPLPEPK